MRVPCYEAQGTRQAGHMRPQNNASAQQPLESTAAQPSGCKTASGDSRWVSASPPGSRMCTSAAALCMETSAALATLRAIGSSSELLHAPDSCSGNASSA